MTFARYLMATCFLGACVATTAADSLGRLIHFDDPYRCIPSQDFGALLGSIVQWVPDGEGYKAELATPQVPSSFRDQVGIARLSVTGDEYRATLPLQGTWGGLPLQSLVLSQWAESEGGFYLVFDASPQQVLDAANEKGFRIPESGHEYREEEVIGVNVGVESFDRRGALYCSAG